MIDALTISVQQTRQALGLGTTKLYELMADGRLTRIKVGRRTLITTESIRALVESR